MTAGPKPLQPRKKKKKKKTRKKHRQGLGATTRRRTAYEDVSLMLNTVYRWRPANPTNLLVAGGAACYIHVHKIERSNVTPPIKNRKQNQITLGTNALSYLDKFLCESTYL